MSSGGRGGAGPRRRPGRRKAAALGTPDGAGRPVLLATLDVPFDPGATTVAVDAAVESGQPLIVANIAELPPLPLSVVMGYDELEYTEEMERSLREPAQLAQSLGLRVERLKVKSLHPVEAMLELARERAPGSWSSARTAPSSAAGSSAGACGRCGSAPPACVWLPD